MIDQRIAKQMLNSLGWIYLILGFAFLMLPLVVLVLFSFEDARLPSLPWAGWTLKWYAKVWQDGTLINGLKNSLLVSPLAATGATVVSFFAAYSINRFAFRGRSLASTFLVIPIIIPTLILGVAFLGLFSRLNLQGQLYSVLLAHIVILIPSAFAIISLRLGQMPKDIEEAAWDLGATEWQALFKVVLPWAIPGIAGGWLLAFTFSFDEFVIAWFLSGFDQTLPVEIYRLLSATLNPSLNAIGSVIFLISIGLLILAEIFLIPLLLTPVHQEDAIEVS